MSDRGGNQKHEAMFYEKLADNVTACHLCHHQCKIPDGSAGFCKVRKNEGGVLYAATYAKCSAVNFDPIEKKPLYHFYPGTQILSIGGYGCNMRCPFCQNCHISLEFEPLLAKRTFPPALIASFTPGGVGVAYTYNEPTVNIEYMLDCAKRVRDEGLANVMVTNGCTGMAALTELAPLLDAANVDLKCFSEDYYRKLGGDLNTVKETIAYLNGKCHVEVTNLIIPGENDSEAEMDALARWLASVNDEIPLHINRFRPRYKYGDRDETPTETILRLKAIAEKHCQYVYAGNLF